MTTTRWNPAGGFTLVELLVVVAIIVALLSILMPSMGKAVQTAESAVCSSNQHQIATAWAGYAADNRAAVVGSHTQAHAWVKSPGGNVPELLEHLEDGLLYRYLQTPEVYRCPADGRDRLRSYSMNMYIGGITGWYVTPVHRVSQIHGPGTRLLTLDEADPRAHNLGAWAIYPNGHATEAWIDWPAPWHFGNGNAMSFADGHVEVYRFVDPATASIAGFYQPAPNSADLAYYRRVYSP